MKILQIKIKKKIILKNRVINIYNFIFLYTLLGDTYMSNVILVIKGLIIGFAKVMPGVSGAILAISMGVYDKGINAITRFFDNIKENTKFLFFIGIGIIIAIILGSNIVYFLLNNYYVITMLFFMGLIFGSTPKIISKVDKTIKGYIISLVTFIIITLLTTININNNNISNSIFIYLISGLIDAFGMVVPGISSTALLMVIGTYNNIIYSLSNVGNIINNLNILIPYGIGIFIGIIITSIVINYLFNKYNKLTFSFILGVILSTLVTLLLKIFSLKNVSSSGHDLKDLFTSSNCPVLGFTLL